MKQFRLKSSYLSTSSNSKNLQKKKQLNTKPCSLWYLWKVFSKTFEFWKFKRGFLRSPLPYKTKKWFHTVTPYLTVYDRIPRNPQGFDWFLFYFQCRTRTALCSLSRFLGKNCRDVISSFHELSCVNCSF